MKSHQLTETETIKILIADDLSLIQLYITEIIEMYCNNAEVKTVADLDTVIPTLQNSNYDLLLLDLHFQTGFSPDMISEIKNKFPGLFLCTMSSQSDVRIAMEMIGKGSDYYLVKDNRFRSDLINVLNLLNKRIKTQEYLLRIIDELFDQKKFPMVLMKASEAGASVIYQDFEKFPEDIGNFTEFIQMINATLLVSLGQGEAYNTGAYKFPAGVSTNYTIYDYAFRMHDPNPSDARLGLGYFHLILFIPNSTVKLMPPLVKFEQIMKVVEGTLGKTSPITDDLMRSVKDEIFSRIKNYQLRQERENQEIFQRMNFKI